MKVIKSLLGVRTTTCNDLCLLEVGMPPLKALIAKRRATYLQSKFENLHDDDPLKFAFHLAKSGKTHSTRIIDTAMKLKLPEIIKNENNILRRKVQTSTSSTKRKAYIQLNTTLHTPNIYNDIGYRTPEYQRIAFTRFRLSSHRLRIETGRWIRIPQEQRLCDCGSGCVQDEEHALLFCEKSRDIRMKFRLNHTNLQSFFSDEQMGDADKASCIYETLKIFELN